MIPLDTSPAAAPAAPRSFQDGLSDPVLNEMYAYWRRKRGNRAMPRRADIDPAEIPKLLPNIMITDVVDGGARFRFRLAGTAVVGAYGVNLTDRYVDEIMKGQYRDFILDLYRQVCGTRRALYSESRYVGGKKPGMTTKRLFLPLSADGETVNQVLVSQIFLYASHDRDVVIIDNMDDFQTTGVALD